MKGQTILETPCSQSTHNPGPGVQPPGRLPRYSMLKQHSSSSSRLLAANACESSASLPSRSQYPKFTYSECFGEKCCSHLPFMPGPTPPALPPISTKKSASKIQNEMTCVCLTTHTPCNQKLLSPLWQQGGQHPTALNSRTITCLGGSFSLLQGGDRPMLTAAITMLWKHRALWSVTAVKATSITSPTCGG